MKYIFLTTKKGVVKKTTIEAFANIRRNGLTAIKLEKDDELVWSKLTSGEDEIMLVTKNGMAIRFSEKDVRSTGRDTMGVRGIRIKTDDEVISMEVIPNGPSTSLRTTTHKPDLMAVMEKGIGKKTPVVDYPKQKRGGLGVKVADITQKTGKVVYAQLVPQNAECLILTTNKGQVVKLPIESIPHRSRDAQGVILMRTQDIIAAATCLCKT